MDSDSGNTTSAGHRSRLMATVGERCSVAPRDSDVRTDSRQHREQDLLADRIAGHWLHPGEMGAHLGLPSPTARSSRTRKVNAIDFDRLALLQPQHEDGRGKVITYSVLSVRPSSRVSSGRRSRPMALPSASRPKDARAVLQEPGVAADA